MKRHPHAPPRLRPDETIAVDVRPGPDALTDLELEMIAEGYLDYILEEEAIALPRPKDTAA